MNYVKLIGMILVFMMIAIIGSVIGMVFGALVVPMKILDGRALSSLSNIKDVILPNNDPYKDRI